MSNYERVCAGVLLVAAVNNWSVQTAIHFLTLLTALTHPAVITVADLFESKWDLKWRTIISEYFDAYADIVCVAGNHNIDCVFVDGVGFECKWVSRQ